MHEESSVHVFTYNLASIQPAIENLNLNIFGNVRNNVMSLAMKVACNFFLCLYLCNLARGEQLVSVKLEFIYL